MLVLFFSAGVFFYLLLWVRLIPLAWIIEIVRVFYVRKYLIIDLKTLICYEKDFITDISLVYGHLFQLL